MFGDARTLLYVIAILLVLGLLLVQPDVKMALHMALALSATAKLIQATWRANTLGQWRDRPRRPQAECRPECIDGKRGQRNKASQMMIVSAVRPVMGETLLLAT